MSQAACPHDLCTMAIVFRGLQHLQSTVFHCTEQPLSQFIGQRHVIIVREITLHGVHHNVHYSTSRLISRQSIGSLRIHHCKLATADIIRIAHFYITVFIGDNSTVTHFASGSRNTQHRTYRKATLRFGGTRKEVPHFTVIRYSIADGLRRVNHASTAHSQDKIHLLPAAEFNALMHQRETWIGDYPTQLDISYAFRL